MPRFLIVPLCAAVLIVAFTGAVTAEGEGILAMTGQYTFFIRPECGSGETYYQKLVPCRLEETIPVPVPVTPKFLVPHASIRGVHVMRSEIPVGCAEGAGPCLECFPKPIRYPAVNPAVIPITPPVGVRDLEFRPMTVIRTVWKPQWFKVVDEVKDPRKAGKVRHGG